MKTLACMDMGVDCKYVAKAPTQEEVMQKSMDHVQKVHPDKLAEMMKTMSEDEMKEQMMQNIKEE